MLKSNSRLTGVTAYRVVNLSLLINISRVTTFSELLSRRKLSQTVPENIPRRHVSTLDVDLRAASPFLTFHQANQPWLLHIYCFILPDITFAPIRS